jgi:serine/threonine protein kinase
MQLNSPKPIVLLLGVACICVFLGLGLMKAARQDSVWQAGLSWLQSASLGDEGITIKEKVGLLLHLEQDRPKLFFAAIFAIGLLVLLISLLLFKAYGRKRPKTGEPSISSDPPKIPIKTVTTKDVVAKKEEVSDMEKIVAFFLRIFRIQSQAPNNSPTRYVLTSEPAFGGVRVYELGVKIGAKWAKRRMSISQLGEDTGSKSQCFYVIYDSHLVVKVPPTQRRDYEEYIQDIEKEAEIAAILAPRECVTPKVSVILKRIHTFQRSGSLTEEELEEKYIALSKKNPAFQKYLKIDDAFVFFMHLSTNFFLGSTLNEIHANPRKLNTEIMQNPDIIWDHQGFIGRYESRAWPICNRLQHIYSRMEIKIKKLAQLLNIRTPIHQYQMRNWFLRHLCREKVEDRKHKFDETFVTEINDLIAEEIATDAAAAHAYRETVRRYVAQTSFSQNRTPIENIVTNLLDLLHWLDLKGVALRDLKPDNLFIVGKPESYPDFLKSADQFSIGVIDVETALSIDTNAQTGLIQPLKAGTPLYATPSHLFANAVLEKSFSDLPYLFRLQDWYAFVGMTFRIITGRNLFRKTAKVFPSIVQTLKIFQAGLETRQDVVGAISKEFWERACREFESETRRERVSLELITVGISKGMAQRLLAALQTAIDKAQKGLEANIAHQPYFKSPHKKAFLESALPDKIARQRKKWVTGDIQSIENGHDSKEIAAFLAQLEKIKTDIIEKRSIRDQLKQKVVQLSAHDLMTLMFDAICGFMHKKAWDELSIDKIKPSKSLPAKKISASS